LLFYIDNIVDLPQFICVQETWIYDDLLPDIPGYNSIHTFRVNKNGGGSAIYIKKNIDFISTEKILYSDIDLEVAGVKFKSNKEYITLLSVYIAPNQTVKIEHLNSLIISENLIIVGDLNAKNKLWGSPVNDFRGKTLEKFIDEQNLVVMNTGKATRLHYNGTLSHLDLTLCSRKLSFKIEFDVINDL